VKTAAFILIGVGIGFSILNWACLFGSWYSKRHISPIFPSPSAFTALALALFNQTRAYWWIALLTDYTFFGLLIEAPSTIACAWRTSFFTRVQLLRATFDPPMPCDQHGARVSSFGAVDRWQDMLDGLLRLWGYHEERVLTLEHTNTAYIGREEHYPERRIFPYDSLDGIKFQPAV